MYLVESVGTDVYAYVCVYVYVYGCGKGYCSKYIKSKYEILSRDKFNNKIDKSSKWLIIIS